MRMMNRRHFLLSAAAATTLPHLRSLAQAPAATLSLHPDRPGPKVPANFVGLSYETQQLSDPTFFTPANTGLVARLRELAPHGVLRLGGNTSDYGFWKPTPTSVAPPRPKRPYKVGDPPPDLSYAVTPEAVRNLHGFLEATGWTCLYGINLGTNTPQLAADEAAFVAKTLGPRLEYFQIGNEADRFGSTIRDPKLTGHPWNADAYLNEWLTFTKAILARVPNAKFGLPDVASNAEWITAVGDRLQNNPIREHVACITHHYYIGGPPSNPQMTIERILKADSRVPRDAALVRASAAKLHTGYRMSEGNTCYRGGKPGVSDVFAAALWSADYMLLLASLGYAGVNLHGGDAQMVANSLGGTLPGDAIVLAEHGNPSEHPHPYYTPVAHIGDKYLLEPVAFGMRFAGLFAGATVVPVDFNPGNVNATAYAAKHPDGTTVVAVINKDLSQNLPLNLPGFHAEYALTAPAANARQASLMRTTQASLTHVLPHTSAAIFRSRG
ncbi:hypothetical protein GOB94_11970 [Granulicella sp. 5B5]|nr:hypothetical protein GOB94_11970 [Granulicella sp. 5B5]